MNDRVEKSLVISVLGMGCLLVLTSLWVWAKNDKFDGGGFAFLVTGLMLMGISVLTKVRSKAGSLEAEFEPHRRFAGLHFTDREIEEAVRATVDSEAALELSQFDKPCEGSNRSAESIRESMTDQILTNVRSRAFLTVDTRPYLGDSGKVERVPYSDFESIGLFLRYVWFLTDGAFPAHGYGRSWAISDLTTHSKFQDIGARYAQDHFGTRSDERHLAEVGITPGMTIGVVRAS